MGKVALSDNSVYNLEVIDSEGAVLIGGDEGEAVAVLGVMRVVIGRQGA